MGTQLTVVAYALAAISIAAMSAPAALVPTGELTPPRLLKNMIQFPLSSAIEGIDEGFAEVHFIVDESGEASEFIVVEATHEVFARAALNGLLQSRFKAAELNGDPQSVRSRLRLHFRDNGVRTYSAYDRVRQPLPYMARFHKPAFQLVQIDQLDAAPRRKVDPDAYYPVDDDGRLISGSVRMEYYIDRDGTTRLALPLEDAHPAIIHAAIRSIAEMRYDPPLRNGRAMPVRVQQKVVFEPPES